VQESPRCLGLGDRILSLICQADPQVFRVPPVLLAAPDAPVPFAPELEQRYRPNMEGILQAVERLLSV